MQVVCPLYEIQVRRIVDELKRKRDALSFSILCRMFENLIYKAFHEYAKQFPFSSEEELIRDLKSVLFTTALSWDEKRNKSVVNYFSSMYMNNCRLHFAKMHSTKSFKRCKIEDQGGDVRKEVGKELLFEDFGKYLSDFFSRLQKKGGGHSALLEIVSNTRKRKYLVDTLTSERTLEEVASLLGIPYCKLWRVRRKLIELMRKDKILMWYLENIKGRIDDVI